MQTSARPDAICPLLALSCDPKCVSIPQFNVWKGRAVLQYSLVRLITVQSVDDHLRLPFFLWALCGAIPVSLRRQKLGSIRFLQRPNTDAILYYF